MTTSLAPDKKCIACDLALAIRSGQFCTIES